MAALLSARRVSTLVSMSLPMKTTVYGVKKTFPSVNNVSCEKLEAWRTSNKNLMILDTRPEKEYNVSHLPASIRVDPEGKYDLSALGIANTTPTTVVCYCSVGYRSGSAAQKLFHLYKDQFTSSPPLEVYNLEGGVFQWACEGRELIDSNGGTVSVVHPYSSFWAKLLPSALRHKL